jgi:hypothetical protein
MNVTRSDLAEKRKYSTFLAIVKSDIALENPGPVVRSLHPEPGTHYRRGQLTEAFFAQRVSSSVPYKWKWYEYKKQCETHFYPKELAL